MFKEISFFLLVIVACGSAADPPKPEECAAKVYGVIHGFKGTKDELIKKLEEQFHSDMKVVKVADFNDEKWKVFADLVVKKITKDDLITGEEFMKLETALVQKWKDEKKE
jgi:hypothetical protein